MRTRTMRTRTMHRLLILFTSMLTCVARAQTGMAATGDGGESDWVAGLAIWVGACFALLVFWGFTQGLAAFFSSSRIASERRRLLRWIGLNFLEPSLTTGLMVFAFVRVQGATHDFLFAWFVLPLVSFLSLLLPVCFRVGRSSQDQAVRHAVLSLRRVLVARFASVVLAATGLLVMRLWFSVLIGTLGVLVLGWSLQLLFRQVNSLWPIRPEAQTQENPTA